MISKKEITLSQTRCKYFRKKIFEISQKVTALHLGGAFSSMELIDYIYHFHIPIKKKYDSNIFIMSKGHSCIAQYVILNKRGIISTKELNKYCKSGGILGCHPDYGNPGIEASTGSLGHGLALAVGICHANKLMKHLIFDVKKKKSTAIIVSHDIPLAISHADKIIFINKVKSKNSNNSESNFHGIISDSLTYIKNKEGNWFNLLDFKKGKKDIIDSKTLEKDFKFKISAQNIETF